MSNVCGLLLKYWTIPSDAAKDREAIESTSRDEAGAYSTECRLQTKKNPDKAKPEPDRQRLSPVARSAEYNNTNNAARLMMTHDGDEEQGHPGHLLWVSLHQAAEHSFPAPHRRRRRHHHVTVHRLAAVLPPMTARWEPPPSMPSVRPPARFVTRPTDEMSREALVYHTIIPIPASERERRGEREDFTCSF